MSSLRIAIVQDYLPRYRVALFDRIVNELAARRIECVVAAGQPPGINATRGDAVTSPDWLLEIPNPREVRLGPTRRRLFGYGSDRYWREFDGVIMGLRGTDLDLHLELLRKNRTGRRIGVWGHLSRSVNPPNAIDLAIERWHMRRCDHVFAYTKEGADVAIGQGIPPQRVTALMNSTDVEGLLLSYRALAAAELQQFSDAHSLSAGKTFGFIGGLDAPKRIAFLAEVLDRLWTLDREVKLLVAGRGEDEELLASSVARGQVVMVGYGGEKEKALICRLSQALINPGRIGLLAVEALAIGIPILSTLWEFHAPEYEYLEAGIDVFESANDARAFGGLILGHTNASHRIREHVGRPYPTVDQMATNFSAGIRAMMA